MKKFISLLITLTICLSFGMTALASTDSPGATEPNLPTESSVDKSSGSVGKPGNSGNPVASPKTGDLNVVPGLAVLAVAGASLAVVSKKKLKEEK